MLDWYVITWQCLVSERYLKSKKLGVDRTGQNEDEVASGPQTNQFFYFRVHGLRNSTLISIMKVGAPTNNQNRYLAGTN
jgi:hypothetical protein